MKIFDPSTTVRVGDSFRLPLYCSEPGSVVVTSSDEGVASVGSPVTVAGTREYRLDGRGGDYLAIPSVGQDREDVTWFLTIDWDQVPGDYATANFIYNVIPLIGSYRIDGVNRDNWSFGARRFSGNTYGLLYADSLDSGQNTAAVASPVFTGAATGVERWAMTKAAGGAYVIYRVSRAGSVASGTRNSTGTMGGSEVLVMQSGVNAAKILRVASSAELDAWFSAGTVPSTNQEFNYAGGHEIVSGAQKIWDSSGNNYDLTDALTVTNWQSPGMTIRNVDSPGDPVQPYQYIDVLAQGVGTTTITARRRRNGVPYRTPALPDAEVYEETTYVLTVAAATAVEQSTVQLMIYADRDGTATISMDNPIIDFPASVPVVEGKNQVSGLVTGSGTCNVTVTLDGVSDVTTFDVEEILTRIKTGPRQIYQVYL